VAFGEPHHAAFEADGPVFMLLVSATAFGQVGVVQLAGNACVMLAGQLC
jgi:hypothetical protein